MQAAGSFLASDDRWQNIRLVIQYISAFCTRWRPNQPFAPPLITPSLARFHQLLQWGSWKIEDHGRISIEKPCCPGGAAKGQRAPVSWNFQDSFERFFWKGKIKWDQIAVLVRQRTCTCLCYCTRFRLCEIAQSLAHSSSSHSNPPQTGRINQQINWLVWRHSMSCSRSQNWSSQHGIKTLHSASFVPQNFISENPNNWTCDRSVLFFRTQFVAANSTFNAHAGQESEVLNKLQLELRHLVSMKIHKSVMMFWCLGISKIPNWLGSQ